MDYTNEPLGNVQKPLYDNENVKKKCEPFYHEATFIYYNL